jgi:hypothetical protein
MQLEDEQPERSLSQRHRTYADPSSSQQQQQQQPSPPQPRSVEQQLAEARAALLQQQTELEERARALVNATCRIESLVHWMELTCVDHVARVSDPDDLGATRDDTADALQEIAELQAQRWLPQPSDGPHFYAVTEGMVAEWVADLEVLEVALRGPYAPCPRIVAPRQAQAVVDQLRAMWAQLEEPPPGGLPFVQVLLMSKKLYCIDQLRPCDEEVEGRPAISWQVLELGALFMQVAAHDTMWFYMLRWPFRFLEKGAGELTNRAASNYARAAVAAAPDVAQQARLLFEYCQSLQRIGQLHRAQHLGADEIAQGLQYPEEPMRVLNELHAKYAPAAGPLLTNFMLELLEERSGWSEDDWTDELASVGAHAAELERQLQRDKAAGTSSTMTTIEEQQQQAEQARCDADTLAACPHSFSAAMKKSLRFLHPDKRRDNADAHAECARANAAWNQLDACRIHFHQLRAILKNATAAMER